MRAPVMGQLRAPTPAAVHISSCRDDTMCPPSLLLHVVRAVIYIYIYMPVCACGACAPFFRSVSSKHVCVCTHALPGFDLSGFFWIFYGTRGGIDWFDYVCLIFRSEMIFVGWLIESLASCFLYVSYHADYMGEKKNKNTKDRSGKENVKFLISSQLLVLFASREKGAEYKKRCT